MISKHPKDAPKRYRSFVEGVIGADMDDPKGSLWWDILMALCGYFDIPREQLLEKNSGHRKLVIYLLKGHTALTNRQIGQMFGGLTYSAVSKIYQRF